MSWLLNLRAEYGHRRDGIVEACELHLPTDIVKFESPMAGMFHWLRVDGSKHPEYKARAATLDGKAAKTALLLEIEEQIFQAAAANNVLIARGSWFRAEKDNRSQPDPVTNGHSNGHVQAPSSETSDATMYFRMTFAAAPQDKIGVCVIRFGETLRQEFGTKE